MIPPRKRRGLVNRTLWETLRSSVIQGVLKKSISKNTNKYYFTIHHLILPLSEIPSLFSAVQAAKAQQLQSGQSTSSPEPKLGLGRLAYGRLKRAPKLPSKPALQSSESSSDDLSGSEDSSSTGDEAENEQNNGKTTLTYWLGLS